MASRIPDLTPEQLDAHAKEARPPSPIASIMKQIEGVAPPNWWEEKWEAEETSFVIIYPTNDKELEQHG